VIPVLFGVGVTALLLAIYPMELLAVLSVAFLAAIPLSVRRYNRLAKPRRKKRRRRKRRDGFGSGYDLLSRHRGRPAGSEVRVACQNVCAMFQRRGVDDRVSWPDGVWRIAPQP
jgi:hypothetical protein